MSERIQAIRGMNDVLPEETPHWHFLEQLFRDCVSQYGYQEIRMPLLESTHLFKRTIGEVTDIVEKEMYTFNDLNGDSLTLRPEGTASCVRACLEHGLLHNQQQKLWYMGPMFRHEKPQKGRYRQFVQLGIEAFGIPGVAIELEIIALSRRFWQLLGIADDVYLQINTLGELAERHAYKNKLVDYFKTHFEALDADSKRRLDRNPLRILDSKNPVMQDLIKNAPKLLDNLGDASRAHFQSLCDGLDALGIAYTINPVLVRGLDYYGQTVMEWVTDKLGSQSTVCAGGRYDALVEQLGGSSSPAFGFAMGVERLLLLRDELGLNQNKAATSSIFFMADNAQNLQHALILAETIRDNCPSWVVIVNTSGGSFKNQFKKADKSGARFAFILGEDEVKSGRVSVKDLRNDVEQVSLLHHECVQFLSV